MSVQRRNSRFFASLGLLLALFALGSFMVPAGCGGGDKKSTGKKKRGKKGGKSRKGSKKETEDDAELMARELIKDKFTGVYTEFYGGKAQPDHLYTALLDAEKALEKYPKTEWNDEFNTMVKGLFYARVDLAEWFLQRKKATAFGDLEDEEGGKKALQEAADFLKPVDRSKLESLKIGEAKANYPKFYDDASKKIKAAFKDLEVMSAIVKRTPPSGPVNLCDADESLWEKEGDVDVTIGGGDILIEATGKFGRLNSVHYFLKDFKARVTFSIASGGFDILLRALPGKGSSLNMGINKGDVPDPYTLIITVTGNNVRFEDKDSHVLEEFDSAKAPKGGGISFLVRQGGSIIIQELIVEAH